MRRLLNLQPSKPLRLALFLAPLGALLLAYLVFSDARLAENPQDRLLPAFSTMGDTLLRMATEPDRRSGELLFWLDTRVSLQRLALGVGLGALTALILGVASGLLPLAGASLSPFLAIIAMIPPLAILPILLIAFGVGELAKVLLIAIGVGPFIARDLEGRVRELPRELLIKAQTLGAGTWQTLWHVVLPQITPRLFDAIRLSLGAAWLFLIAAEAIASTEGLGYRIFLMRRYLAMDLILPYVAWMTLLAWLLDYGLRVLSRHLFPWYGAAGDKR
ncbi:MAG: Bicarbonate transport system permease protein CmpB [Pseudomonadota bacterium]|jgi:NitT/TauT family transport system permease protein